MGITPRANHEHIPAFFGRTRVLGFDGDENSIVSPKTPAASCFTTGTLPQLEAVAEALVTIESVVATKTPLAAAAVTPSPPTASSQHVGGGGRTASGRRRHHVAVATAASADGSCDEASSSSSTANNGSGEETTAATAAPAHHHGAHGDDGAPFAEALARSAHGHHRSAGRKYGSFKFSGASSLDCAPPSTARRAPVAPASASAPASCASSTTSASDGAATGEAPFAESMWRSHGPHGSAWRRPTSAPSVRHTPMRFSGGARSLDKSPAAVSAVTAATAAAAANSGGDDGSAATAPLPDAASPAPAPDDRRAVRIAPFDPTCGERGRTFSEHLHHHMTRQARGDGPSGERTAAAAPPMRFAGGEAHLEAIRRAAERRAYDKLLRARHAKAAAAAAAAARGDFAAADAAAAAAAADALPLMERLHKHSTAARRCSTMRFAGATDAANQRANEVLRPVAPAEKRVVAASSVLVAAGRFKRGLRATRHTAA